MNKKGFSTIWIILGLFVMFLAVIFLGIGAFIFHTITTNLMIDVDIGGANLLNVTNQTMGELDRGIMNNLDNFGVMIILVMIMFMALNGYFIGRKYHRLFVIVDIIILIIAFIIAVYISQAYNTLIYASSEISIYMDYMPKASTFMINLPWYVGIIGVLIMIVSYIIIPKSENEEVTSQVYGY